MTRVPLDGRPLGLTMLCWNGYNLRLLLHTDANSPVWDEYSPVEPKDRDQVVRVHFPLHPDETVTGVWVQVYKFGEPEDGLPVLKVRCAKSPCSWTNLTRED